MATVNDYLGSALPWHELHCQRIIDALFAGDEALAHAELAHCWDALRSDSRLNADESRALEYALLEYELSIVNAFYDGPEVGTQFSLSHPAILALPPAGPQSDIVQAKTLLSLLGMGTRRGFISMSEAEVDALLARIPEQYQTPNVWYYVVAWAYHHNHLRYLEEALGRQTVETTGWQDDYFWLRTNLMYLLVAGRATRLDIEKTLRGYRHPLHIVDFRNLFLRRCEAAGLMDSALHALLAQREAELTELQGTEPATGPKTARIVKQG